MRILSLSRNVIQFFRVSFDIEWSLTTAIVSFIRWLNSLIDFNSFLFTFALSKSCLIHLFHSQNLHSNLSPELWCSLTFAYERPLLILPAWKVHHFCSGTSLPIIACRSFGSLIVSILSLPVSLRSVLCVSSRCLHIVSILCTKFGFFSVFLSLFLTVMIVGLEFRPLLTAHYYDDHYSVV